MSDEIEITRGGVIAVDTAVLRGLVPRIFGIAEQLMHSGQHLRRARCELEALPDGRDRQYVLLVLEREVAARAEDVREAGRRALLMAEVYEIVELKSRLAFADPDDLRALVELRRSLALCVLRSPEKAVLADELLSQRDGDRRAAFESQAWGLLAFGLLPVLFARHLLGRFADFVAALGRGVSLGDLGGTPPGVEVSAGDTVSAEPPESLADALSRLPEGPQVRVEKYVMPDGSQQFVVYVVGTQTIAGDNPWNMESNLSLYVAQEASAAYEATRQALIAAGAGPGDVVHAIAHSQGGMIAGHLGMAGEFEVRSVITAGSPIEPVLSAGVLSVQLRHSDDPVSALAGGGSPAGTGSAGSFVVERKGDRLDGLHDLTMPAHGLDRYVKTARLVDSSSDPRTAALDALWAELGTATHVEATEFTASLTGS